MALATRALSLSHTHYVCTRLLFPLSLQGNPALRTLGADGSFYIRGIEYRLVPRGDTASSPLWKHMNNGGYLGGRETSCAWKAKRVANQPKHDVRDPKHKVDRICPVLNADDVCVRIVRCNADECDAARRELQMTARAQHYVPGVMSVIAVTPVPFGATEGPVAIDATWQPGVPDASSRFIVIVQEVAKQGSLKWVIRDRPEKLYRSVSMIRSRRAAGGTATPASLDPQDEDCARKVCFYLPLHF